MSDMPYTSICGYNWDDVVDGSVIDPMGELTSEEIEDARNWIITEIQNRLPDYAEWVPATSSILLPIDKVSEFEIDWDELRDSVWNDYLDEFF